MSANQQIDEASVDQRAEPVIPQPPDDAATEAATSNTGAEERQWVLELTHSFINNWIYDN